MSNPKKVHLWGPDDPSMFDDIFAMLDSESPTSENWFEGPIVAPPTDTVPGRSKILGLENPDPDAIDRLFPPFRRTSES